MHSFRRGGASFISNLEFRVKLYNFLGNWASDCYLRYLRFTCESLLGAAFIVSSSVPIFNLASFWQAACLVFMCILCTFDYYVF